MIFEFKNKDGEIIEEYFPIGKCPKKIKRNGRFYNRIFSLPSIIMDADQPKTIGGLADKNTARMEKEGKISTQKKKNPWWRPNKDKIDKRFTGMTKQQLNKYICEGK